MDNHCLSRGAERQQTSNKLHSSKRAARIFLSTSTIWVSGHGASHLLLFGIIAEQKYYMQKGLELQVKKTAAGTASAGTGQKDKARDVLCLSLSNTDLSLKSEIARMLRILALALEQSQSALKAFAFKACGLVQYALV